MNLLYGGPGTGKSSLVGAFFVLLSRLASRDQLPLPIIFCAPTGKAVNRLKESIQKAQAHFLEFFSAPSPLIWKVETLDALLKTPKKNVFALEPNSIFYDWVVVDESSMVSLSQFYRLQKLAASKTKFLFFGDPWQLSSVNVGNSFAYLVQSFSQQEIFHSSLHGLKKNFRQQLSLDTKPDKGENALTHLVAQISAQTPLSLSDFEKADQSFSWQPGDDIVSFWWEEWQDWALQLHTEKNPEKLWEILNQQAILAFQRHDAKRGIHAINEHLQLFLQKKQKKNGIYSGLPFLVTKTRPNLGLQNGERGFFLKTAKGMQAWAWDWNKNQIYARAAEEVQDFEVAYAITVYKAQGAEFDRVWLLLAQENSPLNRLNVLYTGLSRAKKHLLLSGSKAALLECLQKSQANSSALPLFLRYDPHFEP